MNFEYFAQKLLILIVLLTGLTIFNSLLNLVGLPFESAEWNVLFIRNSFWLGHIIFGVVISFLTRKYFRSALPIGILSVLSPVIGGVFYLLTIAINNDK